MKSLFAAVPCSHTNSLALRKIQQIQGALEVAEKANALFFGLAWRF
jgi:hypothetical protein